MPKRTLIIYFLLYSCSSIPVEEKDIPKKLPQSNILNEELLNYKNIYILNTERSLEAGAFLLSRNGVLIIRKSYIRNGTIVNPDGLQTLPITNENSITNGYTNIALQTGEKGFVNYKEIVEVKIPKDTKYIVTIKEPYHKIKFTNKNHNSLLIGRSDKYIIAYSDSKSYIKNILTNEEILIDNYILKDFEKFEFIPITTKNSSLIKYKRTDIKYDLEECSTSISEENSDEIEKSFSNTTIFDFGGGFKSPIIEVNLKNTSDLQFKVNSLDIVTKTKTIKESGTAIETFRLIFNDQAFEIVKKYTCEQDIKELDSIKIINKLNKKMILLKKGLLKSLFENLSSEKLISYKSEINFQSDFFTLETKLDNELWEILGTLLEPADFDELATTKYYLLNTIKRNFVLDYKKQH